MTGDKHNQGKPRQTATPHENPVGNARVKRTLPNNGVLETTR